MCRDLVKLVQRHTEKCRLHPGTHCASMTGPHSAKGHCKISKTKRQNTAKGKSNGGKKMNETAQKVNIALCSCEDEEEVVAQPLLRSPPFFLRPLFFNLLLCSLSPLSLLLTVRVFAACCHGYSWSLMHSVTFL